MIGGGRASARERRAAAAVGEAVAVAGAVLVCGGLGGVMEAAAEGAARAGGLVLGLLPGTDAGAANDWVGLPLATGFGEGRNVLVVRVSEALVAIGGAWGTLSEIGFAGAIGRPVTLLGRGPVDGLELPLADGAAAAAAWALARASEGRGRS